MAIANPRKRPLFRQDDEALTRGSEDQLTLKRYKPSLKTQLPTPPRESPSSSVTESSPATPETTPTVNLKVQIPLTKQEKKTSNQAIARRKRAAEEFQPKLQNPFPRRREIIDAYPLKLLRHYSSPSGTVPKPAEVVTPKIEKSSRVTKLLRQFPALEIPCAPTPTMAAKKEDSETQAILSKNREHTKSDNALRAAHRSFSGEFAADCKRGLMYESGLSSPDIVMEFRGKPNNLPEWKKWRTGKLVTERRRNEIEERLAKGQELKKRRDNGHTHTTMETTTTKTKLLQFRGMSIDF